MWTVTLCGPLSWRVYRTRREGGLRARARLRTLRIAQHNGSGRVTIDAVPLAANCDLVALLHCGDSARGVAPDAGLPNFAGQTLYQLLGKDDWEWLRAEASVRLRRELPADKVDAPRVRLSLGVVLRAVH